MLINETKESYGKLSFESFEIGNMSGWHVRTRGYDSNGRMKTSGNQIGYIELRKDIRKNEQQHFLWLERGNMEENIKVLGMWVKGTGKDFVGTKTKNQNSKGTSDNISFELGKLLPTVAAWITKNHPNLVEQKEETEMNELEEETHYDCWYKGKSIKVTATTSYDAQKKAAVIFKVTGKNQSNIRVHATGHSDYKNEAVSVDARRGEYHRTVNRLTQSREMREAKNKLNNNKYTGLYDDGSGKGASVPEPISFNKENNQRYQVEIDGRTKGYREALARVEMYKKMREASKKDKSKTLFGAQKESVEEIERLAESVEPVVEAGAVMVNGKFSMTEADLSPAQKKYREFFKKTLDKFDADSPADLDDSKKKEFFSFIKKNYKEEADDILPPHGKTLDEEELSSKQKEYRAFFSKALKKFDAKSPASLDDGKKKEFFSYVKKNWKG